MSCYPELLTSYRVGCVQYVNALPFHLPFSLGKVVSDVEFVFAVPTVLNDLLRKKQVDIALTSCVEYLDGDYALLTDFGISGRTKILSVNLYSRLPIHMLSGKRLGLTHHSSTSSDLLKVLCYHLWKIEPNFEPLNRDEHYSNYAAILLIGNEALENLTIPGFQTIDLVSAWYAMTALPFVFAIFVVRKEIDHLKGIAQFQQQIEAALEWSRLHQEIIEREALKQCSLSCKLIHQYYSLINYHLGGQEMAGLRTFKELRKDVPTISTRNHTGNVCQHCQKL